MRIPYIFPALFILLLLSATAPAAEPQFKPGEALVKFKVTASEDDITDVLGRWPVGEVIKRFKIIRPKCKETVDDSASNIFETGRLYHVALAEGADVEAACRALAEESAVRYAHPNRAIKLAATPNDADLTEQYHHQQISSYAAWDLRTDAPRVVVAVLDTGIVYTHQELADSVFINTAEAGLDGNGVDLSTNGIDDDGNGYVDDWRGWDMADDDNDATDTHPMPANHGTHICGIIGARGNNSVGGAGVAWNVRIMPLKIVPTNPPYSLYESTVVEGLMYATSFGVHIINCSWGIESDLSESALGDAIAATGALVVCAAGNDSRDISTAGPYYPANYDLPNVLSVTATDDLDTFASGYANYSATAVHVAAPGTDIYSTIDGGYEYLTGTSMAAPVVTGLAALVMAEYPDLTPAEVRTRIMDSVDVLPSLSGRCSTGGRINAFQALFPGNPSPPEATGTIRVVVQVKGTPKANIFVEVRDNASGVLIDIAYTTIAGITFSGNSLEMNVTYRINVNQRDNGGYENKHYERATGTCTLTVANPDAFKLFNLGKSNV